MDDSDSYNYDSGSEADLSQSDGDLMEFNTSAELERKSSKVSFITHSYLRRTRSPPPCLNSETRQQSYLGLDRYQMYSEVMQKSCVFMTDHKGKVSAGCIAVTAPSRVL